MQSLKLTIHKVYFPLQFCDETFISIVSSVFSLYEELEMIHSDCAFVVNCNLRLLRQNMYLLYLHYALFRDSRKLH